MQFPMAPTSIKVTILFFGSRGIILQHYITESKLSMAKELKIGLWNEIQKKRSEFLMKVVFAAY